MANRRIRLGKGYTLTRRELVKQGRRLVAFDLGHDAGDDRALAQQHQEKYLGHLLSVQPDTWFRIVAQRAHNGRDQAHLRLLSNDERDRRLVIALDRPIGRIPTDPTGAGRPSTTPGVGGRFGAESARAGAHGIGLQGAERA